MSWRHSLHHSLATQSSPLTPHAGLLLQQQWGRWRGWRGCDCRRFCSAPVDTGGSTSGQAASQRPVRTRFAPSPTGVLHLGSLRTALFNYLFARQRRGQFILRIEDTDYKRLVPGSIGNIQYSLRQLGLAPDEGPGCSTTGPYGPYVQSQRLALYRRVVEQLEARGAAYRCFCSRERLSALRHAATRHGRQPGYNNRCRRLPPDKISYYLQRRVPHVYRLKLESTDRLFDDVIHGSGQFDSASQEGDFIVLKSDGRPTYHLASVVDDHMMGITHVLRGYEWYVSAPKHLAIYRAMEWTPPVFGHLPLICNEDGTKLSKRQHDISITALLARGYLPDALVQYVCLAGGGFAGAELGTDRLVSLDELTDRFDISLIGRHSHRLQASALDKLNQLALRRHFCGPLAPPAAQAALGSPQQLQQLAAEHANTGDSCSSSSSCPASRHRLRQHLRLIIHQSRQETSEVAPPPFEPYSLPRPRVPSHSTVERSSGATAEDETEEAPATAAADGGQAPGATGADEEAPCSEMMDAALACSDLLARLPPEVEPQTEQSASPATPAAVLCPDISDAYLDHVLAFYVGTARVHVLDQLVGVDCAYLWQFRRNSDYLLHTAAAIDNNNNNNSGNNNECLSLSALSDVISYLSRVPANTCYTDLKSESISQLRQLSSSRQLPFSQLMKLLRAALSGTESGPGVAEVIGVLGPEESLKRLQMSLAFLTDFKSSSKDLPPSESVSESC